MAGDVSVLTPQERLALSRRALVNQLRGGKPDSAQTDGFGRAYNANLDNEVHGGRPPRPGVLDRFAWTSMAKKVGQRWWRRHPANTVGQLAQPLLQHYARDQPLRLVTIAAAVGAVAVLVKPWRLLSVTAVLAALMKTSDLADVVNTLMHARPEPSGSGQTKTTSTTTAASPTTHAKG